MSEFRTNHLQLVLSGETKQNKFILETVKNNNLLLLKKEDQQKLFSDCDSNEKIIFIFALFAKVAESGSKVKERVVGEIKVVGSSFELDWNIIDIDSPEPSYKGTYTHSVYIEWYQRNLEISKNKLPSSYSDMFGKKDGFHSIKFLDGAKLKDYLEYPPSIQEKFFSKLNDEEYVSAVSKYKNKSEDKDNESNSSSSDSSSDSDSDSDSDSKNKKKKKDNDKSKKRSRSRNKRKSGKDRKRSSSRGEKRKKSEKRKSKKERSKSRDKKRDRSKDKSDKRKKDDRDKDKDKNKDREKDKDRKDKSKVKGKDK